MAFVINGTFLEHTPSSIIPITIGFEVQCTNKTVASGGIKAGMDLTNVGSIQKLVQKSIFKPFRVVLQDLQGPYLSKSVPGLFSFCRNQK